MSITPTTVHFEHIMLYDIIIEYYPHHCTFQPSLHGRNTFTPFDVTSSHKRIVIGNGKIPLYVLTFLSEALNIHNRVENSLGTASKLEGTGESLLKKDRSK